jgi:hypothetical protein
VLLKIQVFWDVVWHWVNSSDEVSLIVLPSSGSSLCPKNCKNCALALTGERTTGSERVLEGNDFVLSQQKC